MHFSWQIFVLICFIINATLAVEFSIHFALERKPKTPTNYMVLCITISSAIWSIGMGLMSLQTNEQWAYIWRVFGIAGTFMFMMSVQKTICFISDISKKIQILINGIAYLGIFVFVLYIQPGQTVFVWNELGVTFYFKQGLVNVIYAAYFYIVSTNILIVTVYMVLHNKLQRIRKAGKRFIVVEMFIFFGAIGDMVIPSWGGTAFPGSAITQFWGVVVFWYAIHKIYRAHITIANMSEYIYNSLDIPVLVFDSNKNLGIVNDASSTFFQITSTDLTKKNIKIEDIFNLQNDIYQFEDKSSLVEAVCSVNNVSCQLAISKIEDDYKDIVGYILIINDLSEHYEAIKRLEQAKKDADAANESKSLFLANMSHEIRTPMNAILGFAELGLKDNVDEVAKEYLGDIKRSGETLLGIINDVLNISKIELGKNELVCSNYKPAQIFNDVSLIVSVQASSKKLAFEMNIDENYPKELYGDKDKIREILINLLNNGVKYTKAGKVKLDVSVANREGDEAFVRFRVSDTGIGIKDEDIPLVFEKFKRMDAKINSETEGTGLGLSITKGIVDLMGGTIKVESVYGVGTAFTVDIPQKIIDGSPIEINEIEEEYTKKKALHFGNVKFLAVDDNLVNLKIISKILENYSVKCDIATGGKEAIDMCKKKQYDVVLMDQMMPVMDGVEAMKYIREIEGYEKTSDVKIVALTANVVEGVKEELLSVGFDEFIGKPIDMGKFEKTICRILPNDKYYFT